MGISAYLSKSLREGNASSTVLFNFVSRESAGSSTFSRLASSLKPCAFCDIFLMRMRNRFALVSLNWESYERCPGAHLKSSDESKD